MCYFGALDRSTLCEITSGINQVRAIAIIWLKLITLALHRFTTQWKRWNNITQRITNVMFYRKMLVLVRRLVPPVFILPFPFWFESAPSFSHRLLTHLPLQPSHTERLQTYLRSTSLQVSRGLLLLQCFHTQSQLLLMQSPSSVHSLPLITATYKEFYKQCKATCGHQMQYDQQASDDVTSEKQRHVLHLHHGWFVGTPSTCCFAWHLLWTHVPLQPSHTPLLQMNGLFTSQGSSGWLGTQRLQFESHILLMQSSFLAHSLPFIWATHKEFYIQCEATCATPNAIWSTSIRWCYNDTFYTHA